MLSVPYGEPEKRCLRCKEMWPPDGEFYRPGKNKCRACEYELKNMAPPRTKEARKSEYKRASTSALKGA